ncbi:MAG: efflux RND transporter permease subunit [Planctomycetota bacterium]
MDLIETSVRRPVSVAVVVLLIILAGIAALRSVPIQLTPNVDQPVVTVTTAWFGESPQEIVREIVEEQEERLKNVSGLREMTSESTEGQASIRLEFFTGVDKDVALNEVRDKLRQVPEYPDEVDEPVVTDGDPQNRSYIAWVLLKQTQPFGSTGPTASGWDGSSVTELQDFADDFIKPALERAEGISEINVLGGREREMQVRLDLEKLAARGITINQFITALVDANRDVTAGTIAEGKRDTSVRVVGQFETPEDIETTVVAYDPLTGAPVYVADVADAVLDFKKVTSWVRSQGEGVLAINAQRETGSNVLEVMENFKSALADVNEEVLAPTNWGLELEQVYDVTVYIDDAVAQAQTNLIIGAILAGTVLLVTLRSVGATLTIIAAVPVSTIGTFLGMALLGRNLNVISMAGLTFAVGMGIDNAIVVLENIFRHREMGKDRFIAAIDGAKEVWGAILASTLTNVAVFLPIIFIQEEAGQLFRDISVALTISFFLYLFVAPTVIPMLTTILLRRVPTALKGKSDKPQTGLAKLFSPIGRLQGNIANGFGAIIRFLTRGILVRLALVAVFVVSAFGSAWALMPPTDYLPAGNQNLVFGIVLPPPGYSVEEFDAIGTRVEDRLRPWWEASEGDEQHARLQEEWRYATNEFRLPGMRQGLEGMVESMRQQGLPEDKIDEATSQIAAQIQAYENVDAPPAIDHFFFVQAGAIAFMGATSEDARNVPALGLLMDEAAEGIPGTFAFNNQASIFEGGNTGEGLILRLVGNDNDTVRDAAGVMMFQLFARFNTFPQPSPPNFNIGRQEVRVDPNNVRAAGARVSNADIRTIAEVAVDGSIIGDYRESGRSIDLTVVNDKGRDGRAREELPLVPLAAGDQRVIPLRSVADFTTLSVPQQINRAEEQPSVQFTIQLPPSIPIAEATATANTLVEEMRANGQLPPDVAVTFSGSADKLQSFLAQFKPIFIIVALITYLLLAALFENWLHPLTIIMTVPLAMSGGFVGLALVHWADPNIKLDVLTMLGFVILIGTVINNPILIVYRALQLMKDGKASDIAIAESTVSRVRPIFMSVTTTVAGLAPLVLFTGAGSELYRGLGAVVVGGLIMSTLFTLILTPTLMSLLLDFIGLFKKKSSNEPSPPEAKLAPVKVVKEDAEPELVLT